MDQWVELEAPNETKVQINVKPPLFLLIGQNVGPRRPFTSSRPFKNFFWHSNIAAFFIATSPYAALCIFALTFPKINTKF